VQNAASKARGAPEWEWVYDHAAQGPLGAGLRLLALDKHMPLARTGVGPDPVIRSGSPGPRSLFAPTTPVFDPDQFVPWAGATDEHEE